MKVKVVQNSTTTERRFSSWVGGSILASLVSQLEHVPATSDILFPFQTPSLFTPISNSIHIYSHFKLHPYLLPFQTPSIFTPISNSIHIYSHFKLHPYLLPFQIPYQFRVPFSKCGFQNKSLMNQERVL